MIHINTARKMILSHQPFSCVLWKSNGEILRYNNVVCTSSYFHNNTVNVKFINSGSVRKIRIINIFEINDIEIYI
jgi:hypothetical protein